MSSLRGTFLYGLLFTIILALSSMVIFRLMFPNQLNALLSNWDYYHIHLTDASHLKEVKDLLRDQNFINKNSIHYLSESEGASKLNELLEEPIVEGYGLNPIVSFQFKLGTAISSKSELIQTLEGNSGITLIRSSEVLSESLMKNSANCKSNFYWLNSVIVGFSKSTK